MLAPLMMLGARPRDVVASLGGKATTNTNSASQSYSSLAIGAADPSRLVLACWAWEDGAASVSSAAIGGVSAEILGQDAFAGSDREGAAIVAARVPSGGSANVSVAWSGNVVARSVVMISLYNVVSTTPRYLATAAGAGTSLSVSGARVPAGGVLVGLAGGVRGNNLSSSWSGLSRRSDDAFPSAGDATRITTAFNVFPNGVSSRSVTVRWSLTQNAAALVVAGLR